MTAEEFYTAVGGDYKDALSRLMNDELILRFLGMFPKDPSYSELLAAHEAGDEERLFRAAHTLKGVCANLALTGLAETASEITEYYRPGKETLREGKDPVRMLETLGERYTETVRQIERLTGKE